MYTWSQNRKREGLTAYSPNSVRSDYQTAPGGVDQAYRNLAKYADPVIVRDIVDAIAEGRIDAQRAAAEMRLIALAELKYGKGDSAKTFNGGSFPLEFVLPNSGILNQLRRHTQSMQDRYIRSQLGTTFGTYLEADALRDAIGRATGLEIDVKMYATNHTGSTSDAMSLSGDSAKGKTADVTLNIHNSNNIHFSSGGRTPESTSGHNNNCLFHAFRQEMLKHRRVFAKNQRVQPVSSEQAAPVKPVVAPIQVKPAVQATVKKSYSEAVLVPRQPLPLRPAMTSRKKSPVQHTAKRQTVSLAKKPANPIVPINKRARDVQTRKTMRDIAKQDLLTVTQSSHTQRISRMINDRAMTDSNAESQRLQRLAQTLEGRLELIQIELDRLISFQLQTTGRKPNVNVLELALKIATNQKVDEAALLQQFGIAPQANRSAAYDTTPKAVQSPLALYPVCV